MADESSLGNIPKVHLVSSEDHDECFLVVYRLSAVTICLLVRGNSFCFISCLCGSQNTLINFTNYYHIYLFLNGY